MDDSDTDVAESAFPDPKVAFDFHDLEMLCIQDGGRKKPLQTLINENIDEPRLIAVVARAILKFQLRDDVDGHCLTSPPSTRAFALTLHTI